MSKEILDLNPKSLWNNFYKLTQVPRPSKHEERIQAFIKKFGEDLGLETIIDEVGNVIIRKPAMPGMENRKGVILQAHLDMVPQKDSGTVHDFENDPIDAYVDGDWVKARGTTLGSDNGIGAAAAMTILESKDIPHGPVEGLFTSDEETGMTGANGLKPGMLDGEILINMDSEDEGELYVGCAGGVNTNAVFSYLPEEIPSDMVPYEISVMGLKGGHSGLDIHYGRGNANKIINALMQTAAEKFGIRLASIDGGSLRNAIPREAFAVVLVPEGQEDNFENYMIQYEEKMREIFEEADPGLTIKAERTKMPANMIDINTRDNLFKAVEECPNGVIAMSKTMPGVVETSTNLAIVKSGNDTIEIATLQRSSVDADKDKVAKEVFDVFKAAGAQPEYSGDYPGWKPNPDSAILKEMKDIYNKKFGKIPDVKVIHAGLECGILGSKYLHWDMISFGPTIRNPHSPNEMVNINTVQMFWDFLLEILKNIPHK
jgi:dipeptidase D